VQQLQAFVTKINNDWSFTLSGSLAYSLLLSTIPIVATLLSILGLLLANVNHQAYENVVHALTSALPAELNPAVIVTGILNDLEQSSGILGAIAVLSALFFGSRLFILIERCFTIIYQIRHRSWLLQNVMALAMMLAFIPLVPLMVFASTLPARVYSLLTNTLPWHFPLLSLLEGPLGGLIPAFLLFELIYVVVPNRQIQLRHGWLGAFLAAAALQLYVQFFPFYVTHFLSGIVGVFGFTAILIVFYYYFAVILLLGAEVNAFFAEGVRAIPNDIATQASIVAAQTHEDSSKS
jgi:YihY family inner membrane protein